MHSAYRQILSSGFDKLSSNKNFSIEVELTVPKHLKVILASNSASVNASGQFTYFEAHLNFGNCTLLNFTGKGFIETITGDIEVMANVLKITAHSNHGKVSIGKGLNYGPVLKLNSVEGNILARRITEP